MPLKRGRIIGYDPNRRAFEFTMIDRARVAIIECEISSAAMDQLADIRGAMPAERGPQFLHRGIRLSELPLISSTKE